MDKLEGKQIGFWDILEKVDSVSHRCRCRACKKLVILNDKVLVRGKAPTCECRKSYNYIDLNGMEFGDWEIVEYMSAGIWKCRCKICGNIREVKGQDLRNGKSTGCGCQTNRKFDDFTGKQVYEWKVIEYNKDLGKWKCQCSCGKIGYLSNYSIKNGLSKSCGHATTGFKDLTDKEFGSWHVLHRGNNDKNGKTMWICLCTNCGTIREIDSYRLTAGLTKSCGCMSTALREKTNLERYGAKYIAQIGTNRDKEQLHAIESTENMKKFILSTFKDTIPSIYELSEALGINRCTLKEHLKRFGLFDMVQHNIQEISGYEKALNYMFPCKHIADRTALGGKELDLYYPEVNFAIEFNGNYWHSELKKDKLYHQKKSLEAFRKNIQIFHIFEYEWNDKKLREIIKDIISMKLYGDRVIRVQSRKCDIAELNGNETRTFLENNHLQGYATSSINLGIKYQDETVGIMTFGKPRFNSDYEYELIRMCWKRSTAVIGGTERLFKYFIDNYSPDSIITYCDISKFNGLVYKRIGFKPVRVTQPNYKWVDIETNDYMTRYQTTKRKLVEQGLGDESETEDTIMHRLGYNKIYDSGNLEFIWKK